ncbi:RNase P and RNase MRP subunit Pop8 [Schizosaccharomyces japonicus yFS275]|uniref:RNase P and RNase MRP subunit Pop8 n=1 Tax=Schizosaccharomyces japonicus (strain yFS275 / FY16936) TaxID=402676 RepID=B6K3P4_SCHJY|nr:RNase P and RNase MRP subunit Pop8 [Schizosaccharomyces japonicus yFS275]EEB08101.2 RNase P and RNase MRP subunit Pop8 [Schizosaccharomyces japonicus yFS275]
MKFVFNSTFSLFHPHSSYSMLKSEKSYFYGKILSSNPELNVTSIDDVTLRHWITIALDQEFGVFGSAAAVEILHRDKETFILSCHKNDQAKLWSCLGSFINQKEGVRLQIIQVSNFLSSFAFA